VWCKGGEGADARVDTVIANQCLHCRLQQSHSLQRWRGGGGGTTGVCRAQTGTCVLRAGGGEGGSKAIDACLWQGMVGVLLLLLLPLLLLHPEP
jgi:hypothetical protein